MICYKIAGTEDVAVLTALALKLWPDHEAWELSQELARTLALTDAVFLLAESAEQAVGFAQCQLRNDYVEGTESSPVGYLEGIYVEEAYRGRGIARMLLRACEDWARERGCKEFASDCELTNGESLRFHLKTGFSEQNRIICFAKKL